MKSRRRRPLAFLGGLLAAGVFAFGTGSLRGVLPAPSSRVARGETASPAIAFLGDSLSVGWNLPPGSQTYPETVGAELSARVYNFGIPGITMFDAMLRELRQVPPETTVAVIYLGTNDLIQDVVEHRAPVGSRQVMRLSFLTVVAALKQNGITPYVVLLRDLGNMPRFATSRKLAQEATSWTHSWDEWAAKHGAIAIDLRCFPDVDDVRNYQSDQLHPTAHGTRLLAEHVAFGIKHNGVACGTSAAH